MELTIMTFNTLIDACARCNEMGRLPEILEVMSTHRIELDQITYNTIIKGLCHEKRLEQALELRDKMRAGGKHTVDAHAYGALLDGCSRLGKYQLGFDLLRQMRSEGVIPNNVTLTSLVRLAGHSHQPWALNRAASLVEELVRDHGIRLNWHVYSNLAKACVAHGDPMRALGVVAQACRSGLKCEDITYASIVCSLAKNKATLEDAVYVFRLTAGLRVEGKAPVPLVGIPAQCLRVAGSWCTQSATEVLLAISALDQVLAVGLVVEVEREMGVQLERKTKLRLACPGLT